MVNHVIDTDVREPQCAMVIVELKGADSRGIGLEGQYQDIAHQLHVVDDVLRIAILGTGDVGTGQGRSPALQFTALAGSFNPLFHFADLVEILIQFLPVEPTDTTTQVLGICQDCIQDTLISLLGLVFE